MSRRRELHALSHVKDLRKLLAETDYLRRSHRERQCEQERAEHARRLDRCRGELPEKRARILDDLAGRPVDLRKIHDAQSALRKLLHELNSAETAQKELENAAGQARTDKEAAYRKYTAAMRKHEKFQDIKRRADSHAAEQCNAIEQAEIEDRPLPASSPI